MPSPHSGLSRNIHKLARSFFNRHAVTEHIFECCNSIFNKLQHTKMCSAPTPCRYMVSGLFHSPSGVLFTFPSRYLFTIDLKMYLALAVSSARFTRAFGVPGYSGIQTTELFCFRVRDCYPLRLSFPTYSANKIIFDSAQLNEV